VGITTPAVTGVLGWVENLRLRVICVKTAVLVLVKVTGEVTLM
jgi:hypothetical protein